MDGRLIRRTSPCTLIIGGKPEERCRSEALFLTANASSSAISMSSPDLQVWQFFNHHSGVAALHRPPGTNGALIDERQHGVVPTPRSQPFSRASAHQRR